MEGVACIGGVRVESDSILVLMKIKIDCKNTRGIVCLLWWVRYIK